MGLKDKRGQQDNINAADRSKPLFIIYERDTAQRAFAFLQHHATGDATVLIGDPGRSYLPRDKLRRVADYSVPVTRDLEDTEIKQTAVWALLGTQNR